MKKLLSLLLLIAFGTMNAQDSAADTKKTVEQFLNYLGEKNPDKIASLVAENVDWYIFESKEFPWTGKRTKSSEIPQVFKTLFSYFVDGQEQFEMESFLVDGNDAAIFGRLGRQFKSSGKHFSMLVAIHFKVENNLITRFCLYEQTPILEKAFKK